MGYFWRVYLESVEGFILDTTELDDTDVRLGYVSTELDDPRVKIRSVNYQGGRNRELDNFPPTTISVVFDNRDGLFNPNNTSSPYYGLIYPGKQINVQYVNSFPNFFYDRRSDAFTGVVTSWSFDFDVNGDAIATVTAKDLLGKLAGIEIAPSVVPQESTAARFNRICTLAGLNASQFQSNLSYSVMAAGTISGDALQLLQDVAFHEQGYVVARPNGVIYFGERNWLQRVPNYFFSQGEPYVDPDLPFYFPVYPSAYESLAMTYSDDSIANYVTTTSSLGTATAVNSQSISIYNQTNQSYEVTFSSFAQQTQLARWLATTYGLPEFRPLELTFSMDALLALPPLNGTTAFPFTQLNSYGLLAQVKFDPPGSGEVIDSLYVVSSWKHSSTPSGYTVTIGLEPATFANLFILDDPQNGLLDTNILAF